MSFGTATACPC